MQTFPHYSQRGWLRRMPSFFCFWLLLLYHLVLTAQVSPPVPATTAQHSKQVIGYITQWDAWKNVANLVPAGGYNHLNVDYSQYTILNFSFFGVARDGSLHSGDFRNKDIYQVGAVQEPAALLNTDIYSSWDLYLLHGELDILYFIPDNSYAYTLGYRNEGGGWRNVNTGETGTFPLAVHKQGGAPGLIDLAHQKGVKVLASIGGWSMCKHFPEMAADATKRAKFVSDCQRLIAMGFDGIDLDWEYPNDPGMNIERFGTADYTNFAVLIEQIRTAIGPTKLITSCFSASVPKLQGFNWPRISNTLNYINMMTYDYNGGWSNKAGHNSPLYDYPGAEYQNFSINATVQGLRSLGVNLAKVNIGAPFYGRGVITSGTAALNGATVKRAETVQPDGPIQTCADYTNWAKDLWDGTPNYSYIQLATGSGSGWTDHWDDAAKVPYKTKGNYFLSYDNERSIGEKAQYIRDNGLAGVIIWQVYGDMTNMTSSQVPKGKLIHCPNTTSPLVNKINAVFATGGPVNTPPTANLTAPASNASYTAPASITLQATASDADGTVRKVEFYNGTTLLATDSVSPYSYTWTNVPAGSYSLKAVATDNANATGTSSVANVTVNGTGGPDTSGKLIIGYWHNWGGAAPPPYIRLRDVNPKYNVIQVAFGISAADNATVTFTPENITTAEFISDVQFLQSQGKKVLLSLGGQNGTLILSGAAQRTAFVNSMKAILDQYNFDGFDIDLEGGGNLQLDANDKDFRSPTTAKVVNLISAAKEIINYRKGQGKNCWLTMAPETFYVQTAFGASYGPLVGAYLPVIHGLRNELTVIHVQYYNTGSVRGLDNREYFQATPDFVVAMTEMLLQGFPVSGTSLTFPALREDQVAFGLPASQPAAPSGGYQAPAGVINALNYLMKGQSFGGQYILRKPSGYPGLRGIMTWSVNWDKTNNDEFANNYYNYFFGTNPGNQPPTVSITSPANGATFTAPASITINANAADADGTVRRVQFYNGTTLLATDSVSPYSYSWTNVGNGTYNLTARATDNQNATTISAVVSITVGSGGGNCNGIPAWTATAVYNGGNQVVYNNKVYQAKWWTQGDQPDINTGDGKPWAYVRDCSGSGNQSPTVSITSPASGASFTAPATVNIQASAADADGTVRRVEFYQGTTLLGVDSVSPYSYSWSNVAAGSYSLTAKATDNQNASTTSGAVAITVTGGSGGNCAGVAAYQPYPKIYMRGDRVVHNNTLYESQSDNLYNVTPGTAEHWWKTIGPCTTARIALNGTTGVALNDQQSALETNNNEKFEIYPNPVRQSLRISSTEVWLGSVVRIVDLSGKLVLQTKPTGNTMDVSHLKPGTYLLVITNEQQTKSKKFVVQ